MATNKVVYGNTTLIDLTGDTAEASDVASGKIFHNKAGVQQTGTGTIVTPTSITPSNSSPASMSANGIYQPTASGYAISSYSSVAPSNSSPPSLSNGSIYKPSANGYAISSYSNITPSSSGAYFASGMTKMSSSGYAYSSQQTAGFTLLGSQTNTDTSATTVNLSSSISNFRYLFVSFSPIESGKVNISAISYPPLQIILTSLWTSGTTIRGYYVKGNSGSMGQCYVDITYVSNTSIQFKKSDSLSRTIYFYGVK